MRELSYMCVPGIRNEYRKECAPVITIDKIITTVCDHFSLDANKVKGKSRLKEYVYARYVIFYLLRKHTSMSLKAIGIVFDRDHTSVIHGLQSLSNIMDTEPAVKNEVELIDAKVQGRS